MRPPPDELERVAARCRLDRVDVVSTAGGGQMVRVQRGAAVMIVVIEPADLAHALFPDELALRAARLLARQLDRDEAA